MEYIGKRISLVKSPEKVSIVILSAVGNKKTRLLLLWLLAWTICGLIVAWEYFKLTDDERKTGFLIWLAFWFYFEYTISKAYMWRRSGKEKIKITNGKLFLKREVNKKGKVNTYDIEFIKDVRILEEKSKLLHALNNSYWAVAGETIAFDYYGKTISFGLQLTEEDTKELCRLIKYYLKEFNTGD